MHSDPVADFCTRIRNACRARLQRLELPSSTLKVRIAEILKQEGYLESFRVRKDEKGFSVLELQLKYDEKREPVIGGVTRMSTPGKKVYCGVGDIPTVRSGTGTVILTTSKGLMTDREARKQRIGGEALCSVW